jgi:Flp pilus assembly protein TadG
MNSLFRRLHHNQEGQVLYLFAAVMVVVLGMAALSIDIGFALHAQRELQASTDAAATAGALDLPCLTGTPCTPVADALSYSGVSGNKNAYQDLPNVKMINSTPLVTCVSDSQLTSLLGIAFPPSCPSGSGNAVWVEQQVQVPTFFAKALGISSITLTARALALEKGGTPAPANIEVILDTTASMGDSDNSCAQTSKITNSGIANPTRLDCAKWGVRSLLLTLDPCTGDPRVSCGSDVNGNNVQNPLQEVTLLTFPGLQATSDATYDYTSCGKNFKSSYISPYAAPPTDPPYYTIVGASSDYRTDYVATTLSGSSELVEAVDFADTGCSSNQYGLQNPGGEGTYYAGAITEAGTALHSLNGTTRGQYQNAIILLSDGEANAGKTDFVSGTSKTYYTNDCHQAVNAAVAAAGQLNGAEMPTWVYGVAYGSSTNSSDCSTDSPAITPCTTMGGGETANGGTQGVASDYTKFYSDGANGCTSSANGSVNSLGEIFTKIGYDFLTTRLLPKSLYPSQ